MFNCWKGKTLVSFSCSQYIYASLMVSTGVGRYNTQLKQKLSIWNVKNINITIVLVTGEFRIWSFIQWIQNDQNGHTWIEILTTGPLKVKVELLTTYWCLWLIMPPPPLYGYFQFILPYFAQMLDCQSLTLYWKFRIFDITFISKTLNYFTNSNIKFNSFYRKSFGFE